MITQRRLIFLWDLAFFGLTPNDYDIFLEPSFLLMYYGGFTFTEVYNMSIVWRRWFTKRINQEIAKSNDPTKGAHHNTGDIRQMRGLQRDTAPARMQRTT